MCDMAIRTIEQARAWRGKLSTVTDALTDANASIAAELFPTLTNSGTLIPVGSRIRWGDALCVAQYDTYDRVDTDPDHDTTGSGVVTLAFKDGILYNVFRVTGRVRVSCRGIEAVITGLTRNQMRCLEAQG